MPHNPAGRERHPRLRALTAVLSGRSETALGPWLIPIATVLLTAAMVMVVTHSLELYVSIPVAILAAAVMGGMSAAYLDDDAEAAAGESDEPGGGGGGGRRPPCRRPDGGGGGAVPAPARPTVTVTRIIAANPVVPAASAAAREREPVPAGPPSRDRR